MGGLGWAFLSELDAAIDMLCLFPRMHRVLTEDGHVRRALLRRFPYSIVYEIIDDEIIVLACRHARQDEIDRTVARRER